MGARIDEFKGRVKQAAGALTGRRRLEREGRADRRAADAKRHVARARGKVDDAVGQASDAIEETIDRAKDSWRGKGR